MYTPMDGETKQNKTVSKMTGNLFCSNVRKKYRNSSSFFSPFLVNPQQSENFEDFNFWKKKISPLSFYNSENIPHTRALGQQMARGVSPIRDDAFVLGDVHHLFFFFFSSSLVRAAGSTTRHILEENGRAQHATFIWELLFPASAPFSSLSTSSSSIVQTV